jgi:hypothetical protein
MDFLGQEFSTYPDNHCLTAIREFTLKAYIAFKVSKKTHCLFDKLQKIESHRKLLVRKTVR